MRMISMLTWNDADDKAFRERRRLAGKFNGYSHFDFSPPGRRRSRVLLCLREEHKDTTATRSFNGELFFFRAMRNGQAVAIFILNRFPIGQNHIVMCAICGNLRQRDLPAAARFARHRQALPIRKSADDFDDGRSFRRTVGQLPSKNFAINRFSFVRTVRRRM